LIVTFFLLAAAVRFKIWSTHSSMEKKLVKIVIHR
jgi:hypothetical protein